MPRVVVVHPWLPEYRVRFFELAIERLALQGVELLVAHGDAPPDVHGRHEAVDAAWAVPLRTRYVRLCGRHLVWRDVRGLPPADLFIMEQAIGNIENYHALATHRGSLAYWGHGRTYTKPTGRTEERLKRWMTRQGEWFFAYTERGAHHAIDSGISPDRVTVLQNSIDTDRLRERRLELASDDINGLRRRLSLHDKRVALFLGGLDPSKRIDFMLDAGAQLYRRMPDFVLIVAGDGDQRGLVQAQAGAPWLRHVGRVSDLDTKAVLGAISSLMLMPGRVGLVAVDSFALETPLVTTSWPYHAPEFEYLQDGGNARIASNDLVDFVNSAEQLMRDQHALSKLKSGCAEAARRYTVEAMVDNFTKGVLAALGSRTA